MAVRDNRHFQFLEKSKIPAGIWKITKYLYNINLKGPKFVQNCSICNSGFKIINIFFIYSKNNTSNLTIGMVSLVF